MISYSPLARGVLTGKYDPDQAPGQDTRAGRNDPRLQQTEWRPESLNLAQRIRDYAQGQGITAGQFALAHAAIVEVDDMEHFVAAHHVAGVAIAVAPVTSAAAMMAGMCR